ncbi:MAG: choice-of-anchor B family protein [Ignavibacteriae bacterium]|nr:choice-of-anchor B family protein [Ignavibacteriota bacterium]
MMNRYLSFWGLSILFLLCSERSSSQASGGVRYLGHFIPPTGGSYVSGCWGWTDSTGREYAILGSQCGTSIVEITDVGAMVERDFVPAVCSSWREIQVHDHYAYVVSEGGGGTQIIDLSYLPDSVHLVKNFTFSQSGKNINRAHTLHIRDGYMYLNGCANWSPGGIVIFSLADPENPTYTSAYTQRYIHDCFVRNDTIYAAAIYSGGGVDIIDVTNKTSPQLLNRITYTGSGTHNCATTIDGRYVLTTDEIGSTPKTLKIWSLMTPPVFPKVAEYAGSPTAIVHNVFVRNNLAVMSYYTAGLKVVSISDPENPEEIGGYDTYPSSNSAVYDGAWSTYPFFPSGKIIIGDMATGLYVVDVNPNVPKSPTQLQAYSNYSTPTSVQLTWQDPALTILDDTLTNFNIQIYRGVVLVGQVDSGIQSFTDTGLVTHQYYTYSVRAKNLSTGDVSAARTISVYAGGHAQPSVPSAFAAEDDALGVQLRWQNPSTQIDGTPLNDLAYVMIYRDGVLIDSVSQTSNDTSQMRSYFDSTQGYHTYRIRVRDDESPVNYSSYTDSVLGHGGFSTSFFTDLESGIGLLYRTGAWDTTGSAGYSGSSSLTDNPDSYYSNGSNTYTLTPPVIVGANSMLQFTQIASVYPGDWAIVEISTDQRQSFTELARYDWSLHIEWQDIFPRSEDWFMETLDLSPFAGDTAIIRFRLQTDGGIVSDGWYLDDIVVGPATIQMTGSYSVAANWNLVSLPLTVPDQNTNSVFPFASSSAFFYDGSYVPSDTLISGKGYWLKFDSAHTVDIKGIAVRRDTVEINTKWNIIGSLSFPIDTSQVKSTPSDIIITGFYEFKGSYAIASTLQPGKGYWVKTSQPGELILSSFTNSSMLLAALKRNTVGDELNSLTFTDQGGHQQTLYFGYDKDFSISLERFELPPVPPAGAFDVRYSTGGSCVIVDREDQKEFPVMLQAIDYPVTIRWELKDQSFPVALNIDGSEIPLQNSGSIQITNRLSQISLKYSSDAASSIPTEFSLEQNYPNPFNPKTVVSFQLPVSSLVTVKVYDVLGQEVTTLINETMQPGQYTVQWDAEERSSGVYYVRMMVTDPYGRALYQATRKLLLMK